MGTVTIRLAAAGLTHAKGKSDGCDGEHDIDMLSVTAIDDPGWICEVDIQALDAAFQTLHEQAHPDGTAYWHNCREAGCGDAYDLLDVD